MTRCWRRARLITRQQALKARSRFITLTLCPPDWQRRRAQVYDMRRRIVADGYHTEWIWTTEVGSVSGMVHVHAIQWGDYIPQRRLQELWGGRRVDVRAARVTHSTYISKGASAVAQYVTKGASSSLDEALSLNNGRLHHWSRGFWDGPIRAFEARERGVSESDCVLRYDPGLRSQIDNGLVLGPLGRP